MTNDISNALLAFEEQQVGLDWSLTKATQFTQSIRVYKSYLRKAINK